MKKTFNNQLYLQMILCFIMMGFTSAFCQKKNNNSAEKKDMKPEAAQPASPSHKPTITTEPYKAVIFDSCRMEEVDLSGTVTYSLVESFDKGYYINYKIDLDKVSGLGKKTGSVYHGGGKIVGTTKQNEDGTKVKGKTTYRVKYVGNDGNQIFFTQNARFIMVNGETKVEFNNIYDSCR
jgi:hypothetical protein